MASDSLTALSIVLVELLLVIVLVAGYLYLRLRTLRKRMNHDQRTALTNDLVQQWLASEISRARQRLEQAETEGPRSLRDAIQRRLGMLEREVELIRQTLEDEEDYWQRVQRCYAVSDDKTGLIIEPTTPEYDKLKDIIAIYKMRIDNLETFRKLFLDSQVELHEKTELITNLSRLFCNGMTTSDRDSLGNLIVQIEDMKAEIVGQLGIDEDRFHNFIVSLRRLHDQDELAFSADVQQIDELMDKLRAVEEENDFLVKQIQHLLSQEVEASKKLLDRIDELESRLAEKENELAALKKK